MNKFCTFIIGVLVGSCLIGVMGYAADTTTRIEVKFPDLSYWIDGRKIELPSGTQDMASSMERQPPPTTILYNGLNYVLLRSFANAMDKEVELDEANRRINLYTVSDVSFETLPLERAPTLIQEWVNESKSFEMGQSKTYKGETYILVTRGEKKTGGYTADIKRIQKFSNYLKVTVEMSSPPKGYAVIQPIEYPFSLVKTSKLPPQPISFEDEEGRHIPGLIAANQSSGSISKKVAENQDLSLFQPIYSPTQIEFKGMVRDFEGLVSYRLQDAKGKVLTGGTLQAAASEPDWGLFSLSIDRSLALGAATITFLASGDTLPRKLTLDVRP